MDDLWAVIDPFTEAAAGTFPVLALSYLGEGTSSTLPQHHPQHVASLDELWTVRSTDPSFPPAQRTTLFTSASRRPDVGAPDIDGLSQSMWPTYGGAPLPAHRALAGGVPDAMAARYGAPQVPAGSAPSRAGVPTSVPSTFSHSGAEAGPMVPLQLAAQQWMLERGSERELLAGQFFEARGAKRQCNETPSLPDMGGYTHLFGESLSAPLESFSTPCSLLPQELAVHHQHHFSAEGSSLHSFLTASVPLLPLDTTSTDFPLLPLPQPQVEHGTLSGGSHAFPGKTSSTTPLVRRSWQHQNSQVANSLSPTHPSPETVALATASPQLQPDGTGAAASLFEEMYVLDAEHHSSGGISSEEAATLKQEAWEEPSSVEKAVGSAEPRLGGVLSKARGIAQQSHTAPRDSGKKAAKREALAGAMELEKGYVSGGIQESGSRRIKRKTQVEKVRRAKITEAFAELRDAAGVHGDMAQVLFEAAEQLRRNKDVILRLNQSLRLRRALCDMGQGNSA